MLNPPNMPRTKANPKHLFASLPIQEVPADGVISLDQINLTKIDFRGDGWYAKLKLNEKTSTSLKDRLVKGEEQRGNCSLISKAQRRMSEGKDRVIEEWRVVCCWGDHDKSACKEVSKAGPEVLEAAFDKYCKQRGQRADNLACVEEQAGNDHVITEADKNALQRAAPPGRRRKCANGQSQKLGCKFSFTVKRTSNFPNVLLVRYAQTVHVNASGEPVHEGRGNARLSEDLRLGV
jgi:hypothetical protein